MRRGDIDKSSSTAAAHYAEAKRKGWCLHCRARPPQRGYRSCKRCRERANATRAVREQLRATPRPCGFCASREHRTIECPNPRGAGTCRCGLSLPCRQCLPEVDEVASNRKDLG